MQFNLFIQQMFTENVLFLGTARGAGSAKKNCLVCLLLPDTVLNTLSI